MILKRGNLWHSGADLICVTGNATIRNDGCLVMGRGAALEAQNKYPGINMEFGTMIMKAQRANGSTVYGMLIAKRETKPDLGLFQVKHHFKDKAELGLITESVRYLDLLSSDYKLVAMNFPGIGWGGLDRADVLPLLKKLPDNVEIWEY